MKEILRRYADGGTPPTKRPKLYNPYDKGTQSDATYVAPATPKLTKGDLLRNREYVTKRETANSINRASQVPYNNQNDRPLRLKESIIGLSEAEKKQKARNESNSFIDRRVNELQAPQSGLGSELYNSAITGTGNWFKSLRDMGTVGNLFNKEYRNLPGQTHSATNIALDATDYVPGLGTVLGKYGAKTMKALNVFDKGNDINRTTNKADDIFDLWKRQNEEREKYQKEVLNNELKPETNINIDTHKTIKLPDFSDQPLNREDYVKISKMNDIKDAQNNRTRLNSNFNNIKNKALESTKDYNEYASKAIGDSYDFMHQYLNSPNYKKNVRRKEVPFFEEASHLNNMVNSGNKIHLYESPSTSRVGGFSVNNPSKEKWEEYVKEGNINPKDLTLEKYMNNGTSFYNGVGEKKFVKISPEELEKQRLEKEEWENLTGIKSNIKSYTEKNDISESKELNSVNTHELSHFLEDNRNSQIEKLFQTGKLKLKPDIGQFPKGGHGYEYYSDPTEIKSRIMEIRNASWLKNKEGKSVFNPLKDKYTQKTIQELLDDPDISIYSKGAMENLKKIMKDKDLKKLLNTIAQNKGDKQQYNLG